MHALTLLYHDVFDAAPGESGFPGAAADRYKMSRTDFLSHLEAISRACPAPAAPFDQTGTGNTSPPFLLTIDDGGSCAPAIADAIEPLGWKAHFFITTAFIGRPGFVGAAEILDLHRRGHVIGSHSATHPFRISELPDGELAREWRASQETLAGILGAQVRTASVPGGFYSPRVAEAAAAAGISHLFNSEPTIRITEVAGIRVYGRFTIYGHTPPSTAAAMAALRRGPLLRQQFNWAVKRQIKTFAGPLWDGFRRRLFADRPGN